LNEQPIVVDKNFTIRYTNWEQHILQEKILDTEKNKKAEIKWMVAYKWKNVQWRVKIVTHPNEVGKVEEWDILVSQMTLPSFISAMQKASAFITDEWGITCHAAIVSRELKKSCITGTKIATQVLKDGDLVEVDVNTGIVKIIC
jgi:phosphoenolpyruvate synthase/pyruvate phosphate dikinase